MIHYFRRYMIIAVVIAVCIPLVVTTLWSWAVGFNVIGTLYGLIASLAILFGSIYGCVRYAGRKADAKVQTYVDHYNDDCDPEAFIDASSMLAAEITVPVLEPGAWFLSLLGQAKLDVGDADGARRALSDIDHSVAAAKGDDVRTAILTNAIPLALKLRGPQETMALIDKALVLVDASRSSHAMMQRTYLESQRQLCSDLIAGNTAGLLSRYRSIRLEQHAVMRMRVEYAWSEARVAYDLGLRDEELDCLRFIVSHGNKLAFVQTAARRLAALGG